MKIGGSLGKLIKKVGSAKVGGVSLKGIGSAALGLGALGRHVLKDPRGKSDLKAAARNAALIAPAAGVFGGGTVSGDPPSPDMSPEEMYGDVFSPSSAMESDPSRYRSIGGKLWDNKDDLMDLASFAGSAYGGYKDMQREDERYNFGKPLREAGRAGMLNSQRPDNSDLFADPTNPNGRYRRIDVGSRR